MINSQENFCINKAPFKANIVNRTFLYMVMDRYRTPQNWFSSTLQIITDIFFNAKSAVWKEFGNDLESILSEVEEFELKDKELKTWSQLRSDKVQIYTYPFLWMLHCLTFIVFLNMQLVALMEHVNKLDTEVHLSLACLSDSCQHHFCQCSHVLCRCLVIWP